MLKLTHRETDELVATVTFEPFDYELRRPDPGGVREGLESMESVTQMNRTSFDGEHGFPVDRDDVGATSMETEQDPSTDYLKQRVARRFGGAYYVSEAPGEEQDAGES